MKLNDYDRPLTRAVKELFIETSLPPVSHCDERFRNLYYCFCAKCPQFGDGQDQDSQEFLVCLLQRLREEEEDLVQTIQNSPPLLVYSIFGGQVLNTTSCRMYNCRYTNKQDEPFLQILLPIPVTGDLSRASMVGNKDATVSLITCLDQYIELEFLPGRRCDRCCCTGGNKSIRVICAPLILTISLKRFNAENKKINDHIIFEETFDLRAYMDDRYVGSDKLEYHLIGVVVHEGSVNTGHCFAYVRGDKSGGSKEDNEDFTWYCLNDLVVREVSLGEVLQSQAYMLFYEKRTSAPQTCTPISNHGSSKQRHRRSRSTTYGSGKKVSSERPWKSPDEASYSSWRYSSLEDLKGNGGGRWRSDD
ncbi:ubiquitin carboxyl-terminal hydrolase 2-like [Papaver somniferum]|uniref:ubiquitin carboxyl-terminal hydrolase 2-like n=1 Tax=Papaver somniferum TaxID=3469 RepID=UPI000E703301|nr:ubiquitin carboxyl-terminal hydrolase 2-like [Papaver somniferum]